MCVYLAVQTWAGARVGVCIGVFGSLGACCGDCYVCMFGVAYVSGRACWRLYQYVWEFGCTCGCLSHESGNFDNACAGARVCVYISMFGCFGACVGVYHMPVATSRHLSPWTARSLSSWLVCVARIDFCVLVCAGVCVFITYKCELRGTRYRGVRAILVRDICASHLGALVCEGDCHMQVWTQSLRSSCDLSSWHIDIVRNVIS